MKIGKILVIYLKLGYVKPNLAKVGYLGKTCYIKMNLAKPN